MALEQRSGSMDLVTSGCCTEQEGLEKDKAEVVLTVGSSAGTGVDWMSLAGSGLDPLGRVGRFERRSVR